MGNGIGRSDEVSYVSINIGKQTWIGAGPTVKNNISIASGCMIGAGAVVVKKIDEKGTYVGVPARRIKMKQKLTKNMGYPTG